MFGIFLVCFKLRFKNTSSPAYRKVCLWNWTKRIKQEAKLLIQDICLSIFIKNWEAMEYFILRRSSSNSKTGSEDPWRNAVIIVLVVSMRTTKAYSEHDEVWGRKKISRVRIPSLKINNIALSTYESCCGSIKRWSLWRLTNITSYRCYSLDNS